MYNKKNWSINMRLFTNKSLLSKAKIVGKILVVLFLSALLFLPTPVLALNYNGTVQSYVSNAKVELDSVVTLIKKLPNLSYENGKTTLAEIESKLQKIQTDAGKNAKYFENQNQEYQKNYQQVLNRINELNKEDNYQPIDKTVNVITNVLRQEENEFIYNEMRIYCEDKNKQKPVRLVYFFGCGYEFIKSHLARGEDLNTVSKNLLFPMKNYHLVVLLYEESTKHCETKGMKISEVSTRKLLDCAVPYLVSSSKGSFSYSGKKYYFLESIGAFVGDIDMYRAVEAYHIMKNLKTLPLQERYLAKTILLTDKMSKLSDALEKRVNLAKQKSETVTEYADALLSFSDPDILGEIRELDQLIVDLTKNLAWKA